jgi:hypothetical protein
LAAREGFWLVLDMATSPSDDRSGFGSNRFYLFVERDAA